MLNLTSLERVAYLVATGDGRALQVYLGHLIANDAPLEPLREQLADAFSAPFMSQALAVAPWLGGEAFANPKSDPAAVTARILEALEAAGPGGKRYADLRLDKPDRARAMEALIADGTVVCETRYTGGRPASVYRLTMYAQSAAQESLDPFAWAPPQG